MIKRRAICYLFIPFCFLLLTACGGGGGGAAPATPTTPTTPTTTSPDNKDFIVKVEPSPSTVISAPDVAFFQAFAPVLAANLNKTFSLPDRDVTIIFKECGAVNAAYFTSTSEIWMCYELLAFILSTGIYTGDQTVGMYSYVLAHELGHALIDHYKLDFTALLGKEEDAVDAIAAVFLLDNKNDTAAEKITNAQNIVLVGHFFETSAGPVALGAVHSAGTARNANLVCWASGAQPAINSIGIIQPILASLVGASRDCVDEYDQKKTSTNTLLAKFKK